MSITIDASVFVAASRSLESQHADSLAFLNRVRTRSEQVICPTLILAECAAAIARKGNNPSLAHQIVTFIETFPQITFIPLDLAFARQAAKIAEIHRLRGADSVYTAVAHLQHTTLITWDVEVLQRTQGLLVALPPNKW